MNIGIDIDGTITAAPEFFAVLTRAFRQAGHKVYIVTYRQPLAVQSTRDELARWGIEYDDMHLCGNAEDMGQWKAKIAGLLDLDVMFDDMPAALCRMGPSVTRFWLCDGGVHDLERIARGGEGVAAGGVVSGQASLTPRSRLARAWNSLWGRGRK